MKLRMLRFVLPIIAMFSASLKAQQPAASAPYHVVSTIKVTPGKTADFLKYVEDNTKKVAQMRLDSGEITGWYLLRAVYSAGRETAGDYIIATNYPGSPTEPKTGEALSAAYRAAGVKMTPAEASVVRNTVSSIISTEAWQIKDRVGNSGKGHYVVRSMMRVKDSAGYNAYIKSAWKPVVEERVKIGSLGGWALLTKAFPSGADTAYATFSIEIYPTWDAVFASTNYQAIVDKIAPGKSANEFIGAGTKYRDLAARDLWVIEDSLSKSK